MGKERVGGESERQIMNKFTPRLVYRASRRQELVARGKGQSVAININVSTTATVCQYFYANNLTRVMSFDVVWCEKAGRHVNNFSFVRSQKKKRN
jgi:hypothetical protein